VKIKKNKKVKIKIMMAGQGEINNGRKPHIDHKCALRSGYIYCPPTPEKKIMLPQSS